MFSYATLKYNVVPTLEDLHLVDGAIALSHLLELNLALRGYRNRTKLTADTDLEYLESVVVPALRQLNMDDKANAVRNLIDDTQLLMNR